MAGTSHRPDIRRNRPFAQGLNVRFVAIHPEPWIGLAGDAVYALGSSHPPGRLPGEVCGVRPLPERCERAVSELAEVESEDVSQCLGQLVT